MCSTPLREDGVPVWWLLGYPAPLGLLGASWVLPRRMGWRQARIGLSCAACAAAAMYAHGLVVLGCAVFFVMLLTGNVRA